MSSLLEVLELKSWRMTKTDCCVVPFSSNPRTDSNNPLRFAISAASTGLLLETTADGVLLHLSSSLVTPVVVATPGIDVIK